MLFSELLTNRRSIRKFSDKSVSVELIKEIITDSLLAPSARNGQPWKFIIINNREMLKKISDESKKNLLIRIEANPDDYAKKYLTMLQNESFNVFYNAPCLVMIIGNSNLKNIKIDCSLAATYFMMSATNRGLGTCWVNLGMEIHDDELINEIGIPDDCEIVAPLILGYPEKIPSIPKRKDPEILKTIL